jgi:hypothetical protein
MFFGALCEARQRVFFENSGIQGGLPPENRRVPLGAAVFKIKIKLIGNALYL